MSSSTRSDPSRPDDDGCAKTEGLSKPRIRMRPKSNVPTNRMSTSRSSRGPSCHLGTSLDHTVCFQAHHPAAGDDEVVEHFNTQERARLHQSSGELDIVGGR